MIAMMMIAAALVYPMIVPSFAVGG